MKHIHYIRTKHKIYEDIRTYCPSSEGASGEGRQADNNRRQQAQLLQYEGHHQGGYHDPRPLRQGGGISGDKKMPGDAYWETSRSAILTSHSTKSVLRQISCCQVKQVWKILIQRSRSEARPYILLLIYFILLFRPSISPLLIEYFMAFLMGEMSRWTLFTKLTTSP